jgi:hypothetical protein
MKDMKNRKAKPNREPASRPNPHVLHVSPVSKSGSFMNHKSTELIFRQARDDGRLISYFPLIPLIPSKIYEN